MQTVDRSIYVGLARVVCVLSVQQIAVDIAIAICFVGRWHTAGPHKAESRLFVGSSVFYLRR